MKNRKGGFLALLVCLLLLLFPAHAAPEQDLDALVADALEQHRQTEFLRRWNSSDQKTFKAMANAHGFSISEDAMDSGFNAITACFRQAYGEDTRFWSVEQKHQYNQFEYECGFTETVLHLLPAGDEISLEEALAAAMAAVRANADGTRWHGYDEADIQRCQWSSAMYLADEEHGSHWEIDLYQINDVASLWYPETIGDNLIATFHVILWNSGRDTQVIFDDLYTMRIVYQTARLYHGEAFQFWPLEDKARMYRLLLALYDREMQRQKEIPEGIITDILSHVQSLPTVQEMQPEEAVALAKEEAEAAGLTSAEIEACTPAVHFWQDEGVQPAYQVELISGEGKPLYTLSIEAGP